MGLRLFGRWAGVAVGLGVADWAAEEEAVVFVFVFVVVEVVFACGLLVATVEDVRGGPADAACDACVAGDEAGRDDADGLIAAVEVAVDVVVAGASSA